MKKLLACLCLSSVVMFLTGVICIAAPPERAFSYYMGLSEYDLIAEIGPPDQTHDGAFGGIMLTYHNMPFQNRVFTLYLNINDGAVCMAHAVDVQPETTPPLSFNHWASVNFIGKTLPEVWDAIGPPQTYIQALPQPGEPADSIFSTETAHMEYQRLKIAGIPYNMTLSFHDGRVESLYFYYKQDLSMDLPAFKQHMFGLEADLTALMNDAVWIRRVRETPVETYNTIRWNFAKGLVDDEYLIWFGGRAYNDDSQPLFVVFMYDRHAKGDSTVKEIKNYLTRLHENWQDPVWERGGNMAKLPTALLQKDAP